MKKVFVLGLLILSACSSSAIKENKRLPASTDYTYVEECEFPYRDNLKGLLNPLVKDVIFDIDFSIDSSLSRNPKAWQKIDFKQIASVYSGVTQNLQKFPQEICLPEDRSAMANQISKRYQFFNEVAAYVYSNEKNLNKRGSDRSFNELVNPDYKEQALMSSARDLAQRVRPGFYTLEGKEVIKAQLQYLSVLNKYARENRLTCVRSVQSYNLHPQFTNYGYEGNPIGNLIYCFGEQASVQDRGVEGEGSYYREERIKTGILFWDLGAQNSKYLRDEHARRFLTLGFFENTESNPVERQ